MFSTKPPVRTPPIEPRPASGNICMKPCRLHHEGNLTPGIRLSITLLAATLSLVAADAPSFDKTVAPLINNTCTPCHNANLASGGVDLAPFRNPASLTQNREGWDVILSKIRAGEMPPKGVPRPAQMDAVIQFLTDEFEKADRNIKPDPGRVTARRLNRAEYTNTIRDLLAIDFRAQSVFPTDDLGNGFDNIGDVLTISPTLMEKYLSVAERIASRAVGADPLPKPLELEYANKDKKIRRVDFSTIEAKGRIEFDGEYTVRFGLPGERGKDAKPVMMAFWMDGKLLTTIPVETKPSGLVYFDPYSEEQTRLFLPEGEHVFRAAFLDDDFVKDLTAKDAYDRKKNKFIDSIKFIGPYAPKGETASHKKIFLCDPNSGAACIDRIIGNLAHHAYRRPVSKPEVASLVKFVNLAKASGQTVEQGIQLGLEAILVSPNFLFRMEHDVKPTDPTAAHPISQRLGRAVDRSLGGGVVDLTLVAGECRHRRRCSRMRPQRVRSIGSSSGCVTRKKPLSDTSITLCHCSGRMPGNTASSCTPALFTRICTGPAVSIAAQPAAVASSLRRSKTWHSAVPPAARIVSASCSIASGRELACSSTVAPSRASRCAIALPSAPLAPVTRARLPARFVESVVMWAEG